MSLQHILKNSSVSGKEPLASQLANGELSINYHADGPFLCCKDTAGNVRRVAGVWVATTAPSTPFPGELWLDTSITPSQLRVYKDTTDHWVYAGEVNPASTAYAGIVQLATNGETQAGTNATSAVTPAGLQSKISDSTTTVSSTTIASSTAVKSVGDLASAALPKSGGTITGTLEIGNTGQIRFEGSSDDAYETTLAVEDPTAPRTITLPDRSGTVITTGDTGTVTNTMLAGSIADSKLSTITTADKVSLSALNIDGATDIGGALSDADLFIVDDGANGTNRKAPATRISDYAFGKVNGAVTIANNGTSSLGTGVIVNSNVSNTAAIAGTKVSPDFGSQNITTTGSLGIGTSSPSSLLHLAASSGTIQTQFNNGGTSSFIGHDSAYTGLDIAGGGGIKFRYFNGAVFAEAARFDTTGRLGIGTSSPQSLLNLSTPSTGTSTESLRIEGGQRSSDSFATGFRVYTESTTSDSNRHLRIVCNGSTGFSMQPYETSSGNAAVDSNLYLCPAGGRLGVGTSSPVSVLDVRFPTNPPTVNGNGDHAIRSFVTASLAADIGGAISLGGTTNNSGAVAAFGQIAGRRENATPDNYAGYLQFATNNGVGTMSERMRIDSSGRLLVGTSTAYQQFKTSGFDGSRIIVSGDSDNTSNINIHRNANDEYNAKLIISKARGSTYQSVLSGDILGSINFAGADNSGTVEAAAITAYVDGTPGADDMPGRLVFSTTADGSALPTERMRIYSEISNGSDITFVRIPSSAFISWGPPTDNKWSISANPFDFYIANSDFSKYAQLATQNFTGWTFASDRRIKENIVDLDYGIDQLKQIKARRFNFIGDATSSVGFIAQELKEVVPEAVAGTEIPFAENDTQQERASKTMGVSKDALIPIIVKALQEAVIKIETLEAKVAALEAA